MKRYLTFIFFLSTFVLVAQQEPIFTQFWNNYSYINPATAAIDTKHQAAIQYRNQWDGVNGAPNTLMATYNYAINRNHAVGFNYMFGTIGNSTLNNGMLNYNYRVHFSDSILHFLSIGAGIGVGKIQYDYSTFISSQLPSDPFYPTNTTYPKLNVGVAYRYKNFFAGVGSTQVTESFFARSQSGYGYNPARHYYLMSSYNFMVTDAFWLKPQVLLRTDAVKLSADLNLLATLYKNYSLGFSYRVNDALGFIAQVDIMGRYRIGYSYDYTMSLLNGISKGSHEITLGFQLK